MEKFGAGPCVSHVLLTAVLARCFITSGQKNAVFFFKESQPNCGSRATLLAHSGDRCRRSAITADWAALKFSPEAVMFVIMWIVLCPVSSLRKQRNYV